MPQRPYDAYGEMARELEDDTTIAGRYPVQRENERRIIFDVAEKLSLDASDVCLEIGCGSGNLLIPLSFLCKEVFGVDHPDVLKRLEERAPLEDNITLIEGDFLDIDFEGEKFDDILIYSVVHCLRDLDEVMTFLGKAVNLLRPGGTLLVGDIPNRNRKNRFTESPFGEAFLEKWTEKMTSSQEGPGVNEFFDGTETVTFDDASVLSIIEEFRGGDTNAYLYPQPVGLPFGHTREDVIIKRLPRPDES